MKKISVTFNCNELALNRTYIIHRSFVRFFGCSREPGPFKMSQGGGKEREKEREKSGYKHVHERQFNSASLDPPWFAIQLHIKH